MKAIPGYLDISPGDFRELYQMAYRQALQRMTSSVKAKDVMTEKVVYVMRKPPIKEVAELLAQKGISGTPVMEDDGKVAGIISEKDFMSHMGGKDQKTFMSVIVQCMEGKGCTAVSIRAKKAEDIMSSPAITITEDTPVQEIARIFTGKNINRAPVTGSNGNMTGIVSRDDILLYLPLQEKQ